MSKPLHLHPIFKFYRRTFFCSRGKHETYEGAFFCIFCSARMREWDTFIVTFNGIAYEVKASSFRHSVFVVIEQYNLNVKVGDKFYGCEKKMLAFGNQSELTLSDKNMEFIRIKQNI